MSKIKVRIAVSVDSEGNWNSSGWGVDSNNYIDEEHIRLSSETFGKCVASYWIEAEVDLPVVPVINAKVEPV